VIFHSADFIVFFVVVVALTWRSEPWGAAILRGVACGAAFAAILALRSRTSLDFIYFQF
jgi:hypothetical protein